MAASNQKGTILLYVSHYESIKQLSLEQKGQLLDYIFLYAKGEEFIINDPVLEMAFSFIKERIDYTASKYEDIIEKRREAGRRHRGNQYTRVSLEQMEQVFQIGTNGTNGTDNVSVNVSDNVNGNGNDKEKEKENKKRKVFTPPTVQDVQAYCQERRNGIDPEYFIDFYSSKGWKVGDSPMKDWKAAVRTWEKRDGYRIADNSRRNPEITGLHLGVGEYIDNEGNRRYSPNLPPVPIDAPPRPSNDLVWSKETNTWIPPLC